MPFPPRGNFVGASLGDAESQPANWAQQGNIWSGPSLAPPYSGLRQGEVDIFDAAGGRERPLGPQFFMPPQSGVATNGLPIFNWDQAAVQLDRDSNGWAGLGNPAVISYGFRLSAPATLPNGVTTFSQFSASQITATIEILALWSEVANITFNRVGTGYTDNATMLFANYNTSASEASAFAFYPGSTAASASAGDVWVNLAVPENLDLTEGAFGPHILAHEIGHAIGLAHPGDYDASDPGDPAYPGDADYWQDARMFTVMSYFGSSGTGGSLNAFASGPQLHDIAAAQRLYGANMTTRTGDTIYGFNSNTGHAHFTITADGASPVFAIWDAGGNDTIDFSGYSTSVEIDLREEAFSSAGPGNGGVGIAVGNVSIARGAVIENGIGGSGNDTLIGNAVNNTLVGNGGADQISGADGNDALRGGLGADNLDGGAGTDTVSYAGSAAGVVVRLWNSTASGGDAQGDVIAGFENITGGNGNDALVGSDGVANVLSGGNGNDSLYGLSGDDTLIGGAGADRLDGGAGTDTASYASASGAVAVKLWNSTATGGDAQGDVLTSIENVIGGAGNDSLVGADSIANVLTGGAGIDRLYGLSGNDTLVGGAGGDQLDGGAGADTASYAGSAASVVVRLWASTATGGDAQGDTLISIENLAGGNGNDTLVGSNPTNVLAGGAGSDSLYGLAGADVLNGGTGMDRLEGGADADTFVFDTALGAGNVDTISDFSVADDVIHLSTAVFNIGAGTLTAGAFAVGSAATDVDDRIIYNSATGALLYDADGNGAGAAVQFATLATGLALTNDDFFGFGP